MHLTARQAPVDRATGVRVAHPPKTHPGQKLLGFRVQTQTTDAPALASAERGATLSAPVSPGEVVSDRGARCDALSQCARCELVAFALRGCHVGAENGRHHGAGLPRSRCGLITFTVRVRLGGAAALSRPRCGVSSSRSGFAKVAPRTGHAPAAGLPAVCGFDVRVALRRSRCGPVALARRLCLLRAATP